MGFSLHRFRQIHPRLFGLVIAVSACVVSTKAVSTEIYAGLSADQVQRTAELVNVLQWQPATRKSSTAHPLGIQTLSIELAERKKGSQSKQIKVFQHNYLSQSSRVVIIDFDTDRVVKQQKINSVHLPLNEAEIEYARALVENNNQLMDLFNQEQLSRGLSQLHGLSALDVKASVFEPLGAEHECQRERCALLSLFDKTNTVLVTEPVVNLLRGTVTTLSGSQ